LDETEENSLKAGKQKEAILPLMIAFNKGDICKGNW